MKIREANYAKTYALETQILHLEAQIPALEAQIATLESQIPSLQTQIKKEFDAGEAKRIACENQCNADRILIAEQADDRERLLRNELGLVKQTQATLDLTRRLQVNEEELRRLRDHFEQIPVTTPPEANVINGQNTNNTPTTSPVHHREKTIEYLLAILNDLETEKREMVPVIEKSQLIISTIRTYEHLIDNMVAYKDAIVPNITVKWMGECGCTGMQIEALNLVYPLWRKGLKIRFNYCDSKCKFPVAPHLQDMLNEMAESEDILEKEADIVVSHYAGSGPCPLQHSPSHAYCISRSMYESDGLPEGMASRCNSDLIKEVWVPSHFNVASFNRAGVKRDKLRLVGESIDVHQFDPIRVQENLHTNSYYLPSSLFNLPLNRYNFFSVFKFEKRKNWKGLIRAFIEEFEGQEDVTLFLKTHQAWEGDPVPNIANYLSSDLFKQIRKPPKIELIDWYVSATDMPALYSLMDCFVFPTHGEGWGLPIMEAMAMELPVIVTAWGGSTQFSAPADFTHLIRSDLPNGTKNEKENIITFNSLTGTQDSDSNKQNIHSTSGGSEHLPPIIDPTTVTGSIGTIEGGGEGPPSEYGSKNGNGNNNGNGNGSYGNGNGKNGKRFSNGNGNGNDRSSSSSSSHGRKTGNGHGNGQNGNSNAKSSSSSSHNGSNGFHRKFADLHNAVKSNNNGKISSTTTTTTTTSFPSSTSSSSPSVSQSSIGGGSDRDIYRSSFFGGWGIKVEKMEPAFGEPDQQWSDKGYWAVPDLQHLKKLMRYAYSHPEEGKAKGRAGRDSIVAHYSQEAVAVVILEQFNRISKQLHLERAEKLRIEKKAKELAQAEKLRVEQQTKELAQEQEMNPTGPATDANVPRADLPPMVPPTQELKKRPKHNGYPSPSSITSSSPPPTSLQRLVHTQVDYPIPVPPFRQPSSLSSSTESSRTTGSTRTT